MRDANSPVQQCPEGSERNPHEVLADGTRYGDAKRRPCHEPQKQTLERQPFGVREQQRQILCPAFSKLRPVAVHASAHAVSAITEVHAVASIAEQPGESYVLKYFRGHRG